MKTSLTITKIAPALLKAQAFMGGAKKGANNPFFKSKYADLGSVLEACKDILNDNGVVILQPHVSHDGNEYVETILLHESGEFVSSETKIVCSKQNDPQALGSAITYARRYGLQSLTSMPAEDDDGEGAMERQPRAYTAPKKAEPTKVEAAPFVGGATATTVVAPQATAPTPSAPVATVTTTTTKPKASFSKTKKAEVAAPVVAAPVAKPVTNKTGLNI